MKTRESQYGATAVIIGRGGSKGFPRKNAHCLAGKPMVHHSIDDAHCAKYVKHIIVSTDDDEIARQAMNSEIEIQSIMRSEKLSDDQATVDAAVRHAVLHSEVHHNIIIILYMNVPIRPDDLIDRALDCIIDSQADSVQSYTSVGKYHPFWEVTIDSQSKVVQYEENTIYRRQDLPPLYIPDGGVIAVTKDSLFNVVPEQPHAFLGADRRGIINKPGSVVDIDSPIDMIVAEAVYNQRLYSEMEL